MSIVNYRSLDENAISVRCAISDCNARVNGDVRCREHGGNPDYQWSTDYWGKTTYTITPKPEGDTK